MKPDQDFIKKYTELYGENVQFGQTSDSIVAGQVGEDGKFYAVGSVNAGKKKTPKVKETSRIKYSDKTPKTKKAVSGGSTPQEELFSAVEKALKEQFDERIKGGYNPYSEFQVPKFFKE
jgi:hypothetical protein